MSDRDTNPSSTIPANEPPLHFLVHAVPISVTCEVLHRGRSKVFALLGQGELQGVKDGSRTLVTVDSIRRFQAKMPAAIFKPPPPPRLENLDRLHADAKQRAKRRAERRRSGRAGKKAS
jgi:hypothetical protein